MKRMAAADPFDRHPASADDSFFLNGFDGILGTGRIIPAVMSQQRGYAQLVEPDQGNHARFDYINKHFFHYNSCCSNAARFASLKKTRS